MSNPETSVWKARYDKRHTAVVRDMSNIDCRLSALESNIANIDAKLDTIMRITSAARELSSPPGLCCDPSTSTENIKEFETDVLSRLDLLEKVFVLTEFDKLQETADKLQSACVEPDQEHSPEKLKGICSVLEETTKLEDTSHSERIALHFDIFDDKVDTAVQTAPLTSCNRGMQTQTFSKPRTSRVNGHAIQTEAIWARSFCSRTDSKEAATDTACDVIEATTSFADYINASVDDDKTIQPCILDEKLVNVLMSNMEALMEEKIASRFKRHART